MFPDEAQKADLQDMLTIMSEIIHKLISDKIKKPRAILGLFSWFFLYPPI
jgi:hypothetical protein